MDDDENIPDSNQDQGELENEMESDNESNMSFPMTRASWEAMRKQNKIRTKQLLHEKRGQRAHQKKI